MSFVQSLKSALKEISPAVGKNITVLQCIKFEPVDGATRIMACNGEQYAWATIEGGELSGLMPYAGLLAALSAHSDGDVSIGKKFVVESSAGRSSCFVYSDPGEFPVPNLDRGWEDVELPHTEAMKWLASACEPKETLSYKSCVGLSVGGAMATDNYRAHIIGAADGAPVLMPYAAAALFRNVSAKKEGGWLMQGDVSQGVLSNSPAHPFPDIGRFMDTHRPSEFFEIDKEEWLSAIGNVAPFARNSQVLFNLKAGTATARDESVGEGLSPLAPLGLEPLALNWRYVKSALSGLGTVAIGQKAAGHAVCFRDGNGSAYIMPMRVDA